MERNQKLEIVMDSNINYFNLNCCRILILGSNSQIQDLVDIIVEAKKWHGFDCEIYIEDKDIVYSCDCVHVIDIPVGTFDIIITNIPVDIPAKKIIETKADTSYIEIIQSMVCPINLLI